jgi:hypothetical protein
MPVPRPVSMGAKPARACPRGRGGNRARRAAATVAPAGRLAVVDNRRRPLRAISAHGSIGRRTDMSPKGIVRPGPAGPNLAGPFLLPREVGSEPGAPANRLIRSTPTG